MLICCGQLYLDMVGPVPVCKRRDREESSCMKEGMLTAIQETNYLKVQAWQYSDLLWATVPRQSVQYPLKEKGLLTNLF
jgi:hypothetical protein